MVSEPIKLTEQPNFGDRQYIFDIGPTLPEETGRDREQNESRLVPSTEARAMARPQAGAQEMKEMTHVLPTPPRTHGLARQSRSS